MTGAVGAAAAVPAVAAAESAVGAAMGHTGPAVGLMSPMVEWGLRLEPFWLGGCCTPVHHTGLGLLLYLYTP